jgi:hypothetical protein
VQHTYATPKNRNARAIIEFLARMGYLTPGQLASIMHLPVEQVQGYLTRLVRDGFLQIPKIKDPENLKIDERPEVYWLTTQGTRGIGRVYIPQFGVVDFADLSSSACTTFSSLNVKTLGPNTHIRAVGELAMMLHQLGEVPYGERFVRLAEKVLLAGKDPKARIATGVKGRNPDLCSLPRRGKPTVWELECWHHPPKEVKEIYEDYSESRHIGKIVVVALTASAEYQHKQAIRNHGLEHKALVLYNKDQMPTLEQVQAACNC